MYALVNDRGKQYRMEPGKLVTIDRMDAEAGSEVSFDKVLIVRTDDGLQTGAPYVEEASVVAKLVEQIKGDKIYVTKFKRRKKYRRRTGHRQAYSLLKVDKIVVGGKEFPQDVAASQNKDVPEKSQDETEAENGND
ncbi:MAG: 50S ribosomal protein L21 [Planctomycetota bacterium]|nr:50S ribosomal protein L21 [Planctomycetota bacterium]